MRDDARSDELVFATPAYSGLADQIAELGRFPRGSFEHFPFPDGERYLRLTSEVDGAAAILVGGTHDDASTLDLYDMAYGLVTGGCRRLQVIIPFFGYSTMERASRPGEVVTAKTRALLLSAIPGACEGNHFIFLDLHSEGIPFYFEGGVRTSLLSGRGLVARAARTLSKGRDFSLACVDAGRAKWVQSLANTMGVKASFVFKRRLSGEETEVTAVNAAVRDQNVVIYDDMIRTGDSLLKAARAYKEAGARDIFAVATHGAFTKGSLERLRASGLLAHVVCTDSHPIAVAHRGSPFLTVIECAGVFTEYLAGVNKKG